jgi:NAD(P)-dependent dehydrogenase (short-subunit alcohol dehydrogenase family)
MPSVLVTGAAGGLGGATARLFHERGWQVFAADVAPTDVGTPVTLDVTDPLSCEAAAKQVADAAPLGLDAVVNFAGVLEVGPLVEIADDRMRRVLDINVLGTYRVNKAMFAEVARARGRIVNISSETGWQRALPLNGPYAMSKHAVEAYSDALRRELMFAGVRVIVVQPGPFRTAMTGSIGARFDEAGAESRDFARLVAKVGSAAAREEARAHDPAVLAETVWTAVTTARPRLRYSVRPDRMRVVLNRLPARAVDALLKAALR